MNFSIKNMIMLPDFSFFRHSGSAEKTCLSLRRKPLRRSSFLRGKSRKTCALPAFPPKGGHFMNQKISTFRRKNIPMSSPNLTRSVSR